MHLQFSLKQIFPSLILYLSLILGAIFFDYLLHLLDLVWIGRYFGIIGSVLIIVSFLYSMKKRKMMTWGSPKILLQSHELMGWIGALMILIHGGIHFNAVIPWIALLFMLIVVGSGITGKYLLKEAKERMKSKENELRQNNFTEQEIEQELLSHSLLVDTMQQWRRVHMPLSMIFFALALLHIVFTILLWRWN
jgi:hypothetical protein